MIADNCHGHAGNPSEDLWIASPIKVVQQVDKIIPLTSTMHGGAAATYLFTAGIEEEA